MHILVRNFCGGQFVGKVRSRADRPAVAMKGPHPSRGPRQKCQRRQHHHRKAEVKRHEPGADQTHIVVQRQPANPYIVIAQAKSLADRAHIGQQISMREHHALGIACGSGSVLQQRQILGARMPLAARAERQPAIAASASAVTTASRDGTSGFSNLATLDASRNVISRRAPALDRIAGLPLRVFRNAVGSKRRVDRHWDRARQQGTRE